MTLLRTLMSWIGRYFVIFLLVLVIVVVGPKVVRYVQEAIGEYDRTSDYLTSLAKTEKELESAFETERQRTEARAKELQRAASETLAERITQIEQELRVLEAERFKPPFEVTRRGIEVNVASIRAQGQNEARKNLLRYELEFVKTLHWIVDAPKELERLRQAHDRAYAALKRNEDAQARLRAEHPYKTHTPFTEPHRQLKDLERDQKVLTAANLEASQAYESHKSLMDSRPKTAPPLAIPTTLPANVLTPLREAMDELGVRERGNWVGRHLSGVTDDLRSGVLLAVQVVVGIVATTAGIKAFFYFVLAPIASRLPPIAVLPGVGGTIEPPPDTGGPLAGSNASVSRTIEIDASNELLVHPEYLQSTPHEARTDTKWFLSRRFWIASMAADLCAVTRIRSDTPTNVVLSATHDPLSEVEALHVPVGSAVVLQPRHVVGVLQPRDKPAQITSRWRLGNLHAWLTLQLRYLVFHGPVTLIVNGCRGVRIEPAQRGRSINQAATIGFSANLAYFSRRSETFYGYLSGKQPLLHDSFAGDNGSYIYQEIPSRRGKAGVTGKGLEGLTDALLKVVGI